MNPNYNEPGKRETARLAKLEKTNPAKAAHQRILNRINRRLSRPWFDRICGWCGREYNQLDAGTPGVLKIPGPRGFKFPTLDQAHRHFTGHDFTDAHNALADVRACMAVYRGLKRRDSDQPRLPGVAA